MNTSTAIQERPKSKPELKVQFYKYASKLAVRALPLYGSLLLSYGDMNMYVSRRDEDTYTALMHLARYYYRMARELE